MQNDLISRAKLVEEISRAQSSLETNDPQKWELNKKYYKGLAWAHRLVLDAPAVDFDEPEK